MQSISNTRSNFVSPIIKSISAVLFLPTVIWIPAAFANQQIAKISTDYPWTKQDQQRTAGNAIGKDRWIEGVGRIGHGVDSVLRVGADVVFRGLWGLRGDRLHFGLDFIDEGKGRLIGEGRDWGGNVSKFSSFLIMSRIKKF